MKQNENYEKKYKCVLNTARQWIKDGCSGKERICLECCFPELRESEDEKNANALIGLLNDERVSVLMTYEARQQWLNWLKRKKIPSVSFNPALGFNPGSAVVYHNDESEDEKMIGTIRLALTDVPEERFTTEGTSLSKVFAWIEKQKNFQTKVKQRMEYLWDKLPDAHRVEEGSCTPEEWKTLGAYMELEMNFDKDSEEKQKEQKPAEFDEYKIIKKHITEDMLSSEVNKRLTECGWYVTDEKPAEWSEEDEKDTAHIIRILDDCYAYGKHDLSKTDHENLVSKLKSLRPQPKK